MPIKRIAYSCLHRCGRSLLTNPKSMEKHERTCLRNPERRACPTCKHDVPAERSVMSFGPDGYPGDQAHCDIGARGDKTCIVNCPQWDNKAIAA